MLEHKFCRYAIESYLCIKKQMTKDFTPAPNAIIVDAAFLNFITSDFKTNFERILNRELSTIDLSSLFTYIALDWGVTPGENQIDVYITYNNGCDNFDVCTPSDIAGLNGMAFNGHLGEFSFYTYSNEGMVDSNDFFLDSLHNLMSEKEIKRVAVIGFDGRCGEEIDKILSESNGKIATRFTMDKSAKGNGYATQIVAFPIMMAQGIKSDELG